MDWLNTAAELVGAVTLFCVLCGTLLFVISLFVECFVRHCGAWDCLIDFTIHRREFTEWMRERRRQQQEPPK